MPKMATLILLPNVLDPECEKIEELMPAKLFDLVPKLDGLIAESEKEGRKYLKRFTFPEGRSFRDVEIRVVSEHTTDSDLKQIMAALTEGSLWGFISDAGLPCLADPGARVVAEARRLNTAVHAVAGPSSIVLALMLSGLSAQRFLFEGYLPKPGPELQRAIKAVEQRALKEATTTVFIETPYRAAALFSTLVSTLDARIKLCVAKELTMASEKVETYTVKEWKDRPQPIVDKTLCVFVVGR